MNLRSKKVAVLPGSIYFGNAIWRVYFATLRILDESV